MKFSNWRVLCRLRIRRIGGGVAIMVNPDTISVAVKEYKIFERTEYESMAVNITTDKETKFN